MKFTYNNIIDNAKLRKAIVDWITGKDGYEGAIGKIYENIPWPDEMAEIMPWEDFEGTISMVIPCQSEGLEIVSQILDPTISPEQSVENIAKFRQWMEDIISNINHEYDKVLVEINNKAEQKEKEEMKLENMDRHQLICLLKKTAKLLGKYAASCDSEVEYMLAHPHKKLWDENEKRCFEEIKRVFDN